MPTRKSRRPNVIVFFTDQQRFDSTGVHGNPLELTPNFDRMATAGTHAFNAFTCQPVCGPARACLQTGLYGTRSGCYRNDIALPANSRTLAHYFRDAGYTTGYIGKWHLAREEPVTAAHRGGYQYWLAANVLEFCSDSYHTTLYDQRNRPVRLPGYRADALTDAAIRYIDQHQADPFFLFCSYIEPHFQNHQDNYPAPDGYAERYTGRWIPPDLAALPGAAHQHLGGYWGMIKRLDECLGRLRDSLKSLNLLDDTIVLFTSDHGCHFRTRNSEYKRSCHESSIRVPTALSGPGFNGGGRINELVSLIDLPPTLLDAAGISVPKVMQGRSILPLLRGGGKKIAWPEDMFVQISESQVGRAIRTHRWKYSVFAPGAVGWEVPSAEHYVEEFLYDLEADPYELCNLIAYESHIPVAAKMRQRLLRRMAQAGETKPTIESIPTHAAWGRRVDPEEILE